ncbi:MAG: chemotaxis protein [Alphaproteobacteria bacterium]
MARVSTEHLDRIADFVRSRRNEGVSLVDVVTLAEVTVESLTSFFQSIDKTVYRELSDIASFIAKMKSEIGMLQPKDLKESRIPAAGLELDAVVMATEKATNAIMGAAEEVMAADASDPDAYKALVDERMMLIFEACSFQDITGQRVAKVVETLQFIETRVSRFAEAVNVADADGYMTDDERAREDRKMKNILHGPQLAGDGVGQADVDALFGAARAKTKAGQAEIAALFSYRI